MPPKKQVKNDRVRSQIASSQAVLIEQQLMITSSVDPVPEILKKLELFFEEKPESLIKSILLMLMRICGLGEMTAKIDFLNITESLEDIMENVEETKANITSLIVQPKNAEYSKFIEKLKHFICKFISKDFPFIANDQEINILKELRCWVQVLARYSLLNFRSHIRNIRCSAIEFTKLLLERECQYVMILMGSKNSKAAFQICSNIELYLFEVIKNRLKDIDAFIKDSSFDILRKTLLSLEGDLVNQKSLEELFTPLIADINSKTVQNTLNTILLFLLKGKKIHKLTATFLKTNIKPIQEIARIPNKNGVLAMKVLLSLKKIEGSENDEILNANLVKSLFQSYSMAESSGGVQVLVQIFYDSLWQSEEEMLKNRLLFLIQLICLLSNLDQNLNFGLIMQQFFNYSKIPCTEIFSFQDMFNALIDQSYQYQDSQINMNQIDLGYLLRIICSYNEFVQKNLRKYEGLESDKFEKEIQKWKHISQVYNTNLLNYSKDIFQEKIKPKISQNVTRNAHYYLQLFNHLFVPLDRCYQSYIDHIIQRSVALFQSEQDPDLMKEIVSIFYHLKTHPIQLLVNPVVSASSEVLEEKDVVKICAILRKFNIGQFVNNNVLLSIQLGYKRIEHFEMKIQYIEACTFIHNLSFLNLVTAKQRVEEKQNEHQNIRDNIIMLFTDILSNKDEHIQAKRSVFNAFCKILELVSNNFLSEFPNIYYHPPERVFKIFYQFINDQVGLPDLNIDAANQSASLDISAMFNNLNQDYSSAQIRREILKSIYAVFTKCHKIALQKFSLQMILGALFSEDDDFEDSNNQTMTKDKTIIFHRVSDDNLYKHERFATKLINELIEQETLPQNSDSFIFWKIADLLISEFPAKSLMCEKVVIRLLNLYCRKKVSNETNKYLTNKAILYCLGEVDKILTEKTDFEKLTVIALILKKLKRKITKETLQRFYLFVKNRPLAESSVELTQFRTFLAKISKQEKKKVNQGDEGDENKDEDHSVEQSKENDDNEIDRDDEIQMDIQLPDRRRSTRAMTKKKHK